MPGAATQAQREMFNPIGGFGEKGFTAQADAKSNRLRDGYIAGQTVFRNALRSIAGLEPSALQLEDHLSMIDNDVDREGFAMGWQSDKYAYDHGMEMSVVGGERWQPEDDYGYSSQDKGSSLLA